jgi:plastocyanin domain-containing protein
VAPKIGVKMQLKPGENIIRFTPKKVGTINFTCSMGMYRGTINVVEKKDGEESSSLGVGQVKAAAIEVESQKFAPEADKAPVTLTSEEQVKIFKTIYTRKQDIQPSEFTTKVGQKTRIEVLVKEGGKGCMRDIMIQGLVTEPQYLAEGETINLEFTPTKTGRYLIVCAMNIPRGVVVVE